MNQYGILIADEFTTVEFVLTCDIIDKNTGWKFRYFLHLILFEKAFLIVNIKKLEYFICMAIFMVFG